MTGKELQQEGKRALERSFVKDCEMIIVCYDPTNGNVGWVSSIEQHRAILVLQSVVNQGAA
jgi:hypothetical protein